MTRFSTLFAIVITLVLAARFATAQEHSPRQFSNFAQHVPSAHTEIFALTDTAKLFEAMINSDPIQKTASTSPIFESILDSADAKNVLDDYGRYFPTSISISGDKEIYQFVAKLFRGLVLTNIGIDSLELDDFYEDEMEKLEAELVDLLSKFKLPDSSIWIGFRDEQTVSTLFLMSRSQAQLLRAQYGFSVESTDDSFAVDVRLNEFVDEEILRMTVESTGFTNKGNALSQALANVRLRFKMENLGSGLRIQIGRASKEFGHDIKKFSGFENGNNQIAWTQWDGAQFSEAIKQLERTLEAWSDTELGQNSIKLDSQDFWGSCRSLINSTEFFGAKGHLRCWTENNQLHALISQADMPAAKSLVEDPILKWIPKNVEAYAISSEDSIAGSAFGMLEQFEERMASQALKQDLENDQYSDWSPMDEMIDEYYSLFGETRVLIRDDWATIPAIPSLLVADMKGKPCLLKITETDGERMTHRFNAFIRMATISRSKDIEKLEIVHKKIFESLANAIYKLNEQEMPSGWKATKPLRLDNGTMGEQLNLDWFSDLNGYLFQFDGDWQPHFFQVDDYFVFSTSVELSNQLLANKGALKIPGQTNRALVHVGRVRLSAAGSFYKEVFGMIGSAFEGGQGASITNDVADMLAELFTNMGEFSWEAWQKDGVRESRYVLDPSSK